MKKLILTCNVITFLLLIISGCRRPNNDDNFYTVTGKFIQSCDNPVPVAVHSLMLAFTYNSNGKYAEIPCTTLEDGSFSFTYEKEAIMGELAIRGSQINGQGTLNYMYGIPKERNIDFGNLYAGLNFSAIVMVKLSRISTPEDTIYHHQISSNKFSKINFGPFSDKQILDTVYYRAVQFYDINNFSKYINKSGGPLYAYKFSKYGGVLYTSNYSDFKICYKFNNYEIEIK
ncbi:MAG: hypothetical protein FGM41_12405 [Bacteroidetes bacterium]|nr:hypothetical protein [Bacteroidota bacterium]